MANLTHWPPRTVYRQRGGLENVMTYGIRNTQTRAWVEDFDRNPKAFTTREEAQTHLDAQGAAWGGAWAAEHAVEAFPVYLYRWNRPTGWKGRRCVSESRGGMNNAKVRFLDNGERAIVSRNALRKAGAV